MRGLCRRKRLHGATSADLREMYYEWYFRRLAWKCFELDERAQSALLVVAQYWDDEANDAVHLATYLYDDPDPSWRNVPDSPGDGDPPWMDEGPDIVREAEFQLGPFTVDENNSPVYSFFEDDNHSQIVAFASHAPEGFTQESPEGQAYRPLAIARRSPSWHARVGKAPIAELVDLEIVGKLDRPHDEDQWLVGDFECDPAEAWPPRPPHPDLDDALVRWRAPLETAGYLPPEGDEREPLSNDEVLDGIEAGEAPALLRRALALIDGPPRSPGAESELERLTRWVSHYLVQHLPRTP
ncbi:MAG: hypothetical protein AAF533_26785 [Acidobacteriota bacterium]